MVLGVDPWVINGHTHRGMIRVSYSHRAALPGALCVQFWIFSQFTPVWVGSWWHLGAAVSPVHVTDAPAPALPPPHRGLCPKEEGATLESKVKEEAFSDTFN